MRDIVVPGTFGTNSNTWNSNMRDIVVPGTFGTNSNTWNSNMHDIVVPGTFLVQIAIQGIVICVI